MVTFRYSLPLFFPVIRLVFFPRESALLSFESIKLVEKVERFDNRSICIV